MISFLPSCAIVTGGLGGWMLIAGIGNLVGFGSSSFSISEMIAMKPLQEEPAINTPLLRRAVTDPRAAHLVLAVIVAAELAIGIALVMAATLFICAATGIFPGAVSLARDLATIAGTGAAGLGFTMLIGGTWFAYYIRQPELFMGHMLMISVSIGSLLLISLA